jgi:hypothetical protein
MSQYFKRSYWIIAAVLIGSIVFTFSTSCKKQELLSKSNITFSIDTLVFDTIFTTIGSATQQFKIYNPDKKGIMLEEVELMGGKNSPFRINVDGVSGTSFSNLSVNGNDSLYVFVDVKLKVNNATQPLVIEDSIRVKTNGKNQYLQLMVWGQDAYFHYREVLDESVWKNDKPHVIVDYAAVDSAKSLTIPAGTKIHLHKNSMLWVYKGEIHINGTIDNNVIIQGDRLDAFYKTISGQYYGVYLHEALPSTINYTVIKNGSAGIHVNSSAPNSTEPTLTLTNSVIQNNARYGVFLFANPYLKMQNCIVSKNESYALFVLQGATYDITQCHLLNYSKSSTDGAAIAFKNNYYNQTENATYISPIIGTIKNSIVYGYKKDEVVYDTISQPGVDIKTDFKSCLIKSTIESTTNNFENVFLNNDPNFTNVVNNDFHFTIESILNGNANPTYSLPYDIEQVPRSLISPDIGAYELE